MQLVSVGDPDDRRLDDFRSLTDTALRRLSEPAGGLYIAESAKVIERACGAGHRPRAVMTQQRWVDGLSSLLAEVDVPVYVVPDAVAEAVTGYPVHRGALASMQRPALPSVGELLSQLGDRRARVAVFEDMVEHTNLGAAFRSAAALGVDAVIVSPRCADPLYRRAIKVSMGTVFQVPWTRADAWPGDLDAMREAGFTVAGMTLGAEAITLDELVEERHPRLALVFGTEGDGLTSEVDAQLDRRVTIPMTGAVDSLNVAAASAVAFYATR